MVGFEVFLGIEQAHSESFSPSFPAPTSYRYVAASEHPCPRSRVTVVRSALVDLSLGSWVLDQGLEVYPTSAVAAPAADGLDYLLAVMTKRAEKYPTLQTVEAVALLAVVLLLDGGGVLGVLR